MVATTGRNLRDPRRLSAIATQVFPSPEQVLLSLKPETPPYNTAARKRAIGK